MSTHKQISLALTVLLLASLACQYLPTPVPEEDPAAPIEDLVETAVAGTQTAAALLGPLPTDTSEPIPEPPSFLQVAAFQTS